MNAVTNITFAIPDFQTGSEIIARLPMANPAQAANDLVRLLDSLVAIPPDSETYFRLLEHARLPIAFVTEDLAKRYLHKPLPLGDVEEDLFQQVTTLWRKAARAYAHCAERDSPDDHGPAHAQRVATTLHRCIQNTGMTIVEHLRARRELPWGLWLDLHGYYASAEEWEIATLTINDPLEPLGRSTHIQAAYVSFLLCDMAGCYSLSLRDQALMRRWATYWAPLVSLRKAHAGEALPQFVIDLMHDAALRPIADCLQTEHLRCLDTSRLALQMTQIRQQLRQRTPPAQLGLGEDCSAGQCNRLLETLSRPWSQARAPRKFRRHATSGASQLCTGFEDMHFHISGKEFEQPENVRTYSRREYESLFAFRHQVDPTQVLQVRKEQYARGLDTWEVVNQSANGFRLADAGERGRPDRRRARPARSAARHRRALDRRGRRDAVGIQQQLPARLPAAGDSRGQCRAVAGAAAGLVPPRANHRAVYRRGVAGPPDARTRLGPRLRPGDLRDLLTCWRPTRPPAPSPESAQ